MTFSVYTTDDMSGLLEIPWCDKSQKHSTVYNRKQWEM